MRFEISDEQRSLQESVRALLAARFPLSEVRAGYEAGDVGDRADAAGDPVKLWTWIGEQGWLAVLVPEQYGGLGLGLLDAALVARCFGAAVLPGPYLPTLVGAEAIRLAGTEQQRIDWLPRVAAGEVKLAFGLHADAGAGWDSAAVGVSAGSDSTLTGTVVNVEYAQRADALIIAARVADSVGLYLVDPSAPGVVIEPRPSIDRTVRLADVRLDGASAELLPDGCDAVLETLLDRAAVLYAHDLVGLAREALVRTVRYDKERVQFGRPVGSFQAVKHMLADLHVAVTMAEHSTLYAAHVLDGHEPATDTRLAASAAKAKASDAARDTATGMIQLHGGIGFTWEHDAHFFLKRAKREEYAYGDGAWHRERIATVIIDGQ